MHISHFRSIDGFLNIKIPRSM